MLYEVVDKVIGCEGYGRAFNRAVPTKEDVLRDYEFNLCPENGLGSGYVTEKIPEAFHAGCVPITWCHPQALARDFNPAAVINLYGLSKSKMVDELTQLLRSEDRFDSLLSEPLLLNKPRLDGIREFVLGARLT